MRMPSIRPPRAWWRVKHAIHAAFLEIFDRTPNLHTATVTLLGDGDEVALEMIATGTTVKPHPLLPGSKAGVKIENHGVHWFGFRDGKIIKDRAYFDLSLMFEQSRRTDATK